MLKDLDDLMNPKEERNLMPAYFERQGFAKNTMAMLEHFHELDKAHHVEDSPASQQELNDYAVFALRQLYLRTLKRTDVGEFLKGLGCAVTTISERDGHKVTTYSASPQALLLIKAEVMSRGLAYNLFFEFSERSVAVIEEGFKR